MLQQSSVHLSKIRDRLTDQQALSQVSKQECHFGLLKTVDKAYKCNLVGIPQLCGHLIAPFKGFLHPHWVTLGVSLK